MTAKLQFIMIYTFLTAATGINYFISVDSIPHLKRSVQKHHQCLQLTYYFHYSNTSHSVTTARFSSSPMSSASRWLPSMTGSEPPSSSPQNPTHNSTIALVSYQRDDDSAKPQRRRRRNPTAEETTALETAFTQSNYLTASMRDDLITRTGLSLAKLYKWFDNRRSKKRVVTGGGVSLNSSSNGGNIALGITSANISSGGGGSGSDALFAHGRAISTYGMGGSASASDMSIMAAYHANTSSSLAPSAAANSLAPMNSAASGTFPLQRSRSGPLVDSASDTMLTSGAFPAFAPAASHEPLLRRSSPGFDREPDSESMPIILAPLCVRREDVKCVCHKFIYPV